MMDHAQAEKDSAVERYLLGQMSEPQQDQFEEHFFSCRMCAEEVRIGEAFLANMRPVLAEMPKLAIRPEPWRPSWWQMLIPRWNLAPAALAACGVLASIVGYQNMFQMPALRAKAERAQAVSSGPVFTVSMERDGGPAQSISRRESIATVVVAHDWDADYPSYVVEVRRQGGSLIRRVTRPATRGGISVTLQPLELEAGKYTIAVQGVREDQSGTQPLGRVTVEITE